MPINPLLSDAGVCILLHFLIRSLCEMEEKTQFFYSFDAFNFDNCSPHNIHLNWNPCRAVFIGCICHFLRSDFVFRRKPKRNNVKWANHTTIERLLINYACKIQMTNLNDLFYMHSLWAHEHAIGLNWFCVFIKIDDRIDVYLCLVASGHMFMIVVSNCSCCREFFYRIPAKLPTNNWACYCLYQD